MSVWNHGWFGCSSLTVDTYATVEKDTIQVHRGDQVMAVKSSSDIREISWVDGSMLLFLGKGSMLCGFSLDGNQGVVDVKDYERSEVHLNEGCVLLVKDKDADTVIRPKMENGNVSLEDAQRFPFPVKHEEDEKSGSVPLVSTVEGLKQEKEEENEKKVEVKKEKKEEEKKGEVKEGKEKEEEEERKEEKEEVKDVKEEKVEEEEKKEMKDEVKVKGEEKEEVKEAMKEGEKEEKAIKEEKTEEKEEMEVKEEEKEEVKEPTSQHPLGLRQSLSKGNIFNQPAKPMKGSLFGSNSTWSGAIGLFDDDSRKKATSGNESSQPAASWSPVNYSFGSGTGGLFGSNTSKDASSAGEVASKPKASEASTRHFAKGLFDQTGHSTKQLSKPVSSDIKEVETVDEPASKPPFGSGSGLFGGSTATTSLFGAKKEEVKENAPKPPAPSFGGGLFGVKKESTEESATKPATTFGQGLFGRNMESTSLFGGKKESDSGVAADKSASPFGKGGLFSGGNETSSGLFGSRVDFSVKEKSTPRISRGGKGGIFGAQKDEDVQEPSSLESGRGLFSTSAQSKEKTGTSLLGSNSSSGLFNSAKKEEEVKESAPKPPAPSFGGSSSGLFSNNSSGGLFNSAKKEEEVKESAPKPPAPSFGGSSSGLFSNNSSGTTTIDKKAASSTTMDTQPHDESLTSFVSMVDDVPTTVDLLLSQADLFVEEVCKDEEISDLNTDSLEDSLSSIVNRIQDCDSHLSRICGQETMVRHDCVEMRCRMKLLRSVKISELKEQVMKSSRLWSKHYDEVSKQNSSLDSMDDRVCLLQREVGLLRDELLSMGSLK